MGPNRPTETERSTFTTTRITSITFLSESWPVRSRGGIMQRELWDEKRRGYR